MTVSGTMRHTLYVYVLFNGLRHHVADSITHGLVYRFRHHAARFVRHRFCGGFTDHVAHAVVTVLNTLLGDHLADAVVDEPFCRCSVV